MDMKRDEKDKNIIKETKQGMRSKNNNNGGEEICDFHENKFDLRPILLLMAACGCYSLQDNIRKFLSKILWVYKGFLVIVILLYAVRSASYLGKINMTATTFVAFFISLQSLGNIFISWKTFSVKHGHYCRAKKMFEKVLLSLAVNNIPISTSYFKRRQCLIVIVAVAISLISITGQAGVAFAVVAIPDENDKIQLNLTYSYTQPFEDGIFSRCVLFLALVLHILPYSLPGFFLMVISVMILMTFKALNRRLQNLFHGDQNILFDHLEELRKIHTDLCSTLNCFDKDLGHLFGNIFLWTVIEGILVLYSYIKFSVSLPVQMIMLYYLVVAFGILTVMSILAALVHEAAHEPLDVIYNIEARHMDLDKTVQLNLFLSKLTGTQVGFTTFGLLTITKEFVLTVTGAFLTYFAVLYTL